jgi:tRNA (uracil-5-)-methyltransferase TRM9
MRYNQRMQEAITKQLIALNSEFYQTFAKPFSATRMRIQPGVRRILKNIKGSGQILDLGCGNGEIYSALKDLGFNGNYVGIDSNDTFLNIAKSKHQQETNPEKNAYFILADLTKPKWTKNLPPFHYNWIIAFATIHHIPSQNLRNRLIHQIQDLFSHNSGLSRPSFFHSEWQFLNNPRFLYKIVPWCTIGISEDDIEPGDFLVDWRYEGYGIRYVHYFSEQELEHLANENGFQIIDTFYSDGEGGNLSLYQTWVLK